MGLEKHVNLVCRRAGFHPSAVVLVATARCATTATATWPRAPRTSSGTSRSFGVGIDPVVAVNRFPEDSDADVELVRKLALEYGASRRRRRRATPSGGMARLLSLRRSPRPASGPQGCISRMTCRIRSSRRSRSWRARSTARPASSSATTPSRRSSPASGKGSSACRSAWRRHRCRCPTTPHPECTRGLHPPGPRDSPVHRSGLARRPLRRPDDHARPEAPIRRRSTSTSTSTEGRLGSDDNNMNGHHALHQSASFSATIRVRLENHPGAFAAPARSRAEGLLGAIDLVRVEADHKIRDVAVLAADASHRAHSGRGPRHRRRRARALVGPDVPPPPRRQAEVRPRAAEDAGRPVDGLHARGRPCLACDRRQPSQGLGSDHQAEHGRRRHRRDRRARPATSGRRARCP